MEYNDRYSVMGIGRPDPETMCSGQCEGTGLIPVWMTTPGARMDCRPDESETDETLKNLWLEAEKKEKTNDGYHFVKCPDCGGSGKRHEHQLD